MLIRLNAVCSAMRVAGLLAPVVLTFFLSGCGGSSEPTLALIPVTGTVWLDGKPFAGVTVVFNPVPGTQGNGAYGVTDAEGKFSLNDYQDHKGCPAGDYGVTFTKLTLPDGSPIPAGSPGVGMKEQVPKVYTIFNAHSIIQAAKVAPPESQFDFRLDSNMKVPPSLLQ